MGVSRAALEIILQARDDGARVLKSSGRALKDYGGIASMVATGGMALASAGAAAIAGGALAAGKAIVDFSSDTADAMRLVEARLGSSQAAMADFEQQAIDVFESGWGSGIEDVADSMMRVNLVLNEQGDALEESTRRALILRDVFAIDVRDAVAAAATAVKSGLVESSEEAFDLITAGFRAGLDQAGDFGDTIREYSSDFARMGFSGEEMLAVLNAGLEAGAYNADVVADGIREFNIRLQEGGPAVREALDTLFEGLMGDAAASERLEEAISRANTAIDDQKRALERNNEALDEAEGLYAAAADQVNELERKLNEAKRQLQGMAAPELEGMADMEDQIFDVEMAIKSAQLALMDIPRGTKDYEDAEIRIDELNQQLDRLQLERDLTFDRQLRNIERAVRDSTTEAVSYEEAMTAIADKEGEIASLSDELDRMRSVMQENSVTVDEYRERGESLATSIERTEEYVSALELALQSVNMPSDVFLQQMAEGAMTGKEALFLVTEQLAAIEDPLERNRLGVALFGSKWEDVGGQVFIAAGQARDAITDVAGATDAAGEKMQTGLGGAIKELWRTFVGGFGSMRHEADGVVDRFTSGVVPELQEGVDLINIMFASARGMVVDYLLPALESLWESLGLGEEDFESLSGGLGKFVGMLITTGIKGLIVSLTFGIRGLSTVIEIGASAIDLFKGGLERLRTPIEWVEDRIGDLRDAFSRLTIPDWLMPGSPTPFELGLRGIGDALDRLPDLKSQFDVGATSAPMALAGAGGGGVVQITNNFGAGSVRNHDDIEEIARRQEEILNIRGLRSWGG
jgi:hypothetical protein